MSRVPGSEDHIVPESLVYANLSPFRLLEMVWVSENDIVLGRTSNSGSALEDILILFRLASVMASEVHAIALRPSLESLDTFGLIKRKFRGSDKSHCAPDHALNPRWCY
jgi:hypothetical protein